MGVKTKKIACVDIIGAPTITHIINYLAANYIYK